KMTFRRTMDPTGLPATGSPAANAMGLKFTVNSLPERLCVLLTRNDTGAPLAGVPFFAFAMVAVPSYSSAAGNALRIPLGTLASDHAGYLSYDLQPLGRRMSELVNTRAGGNAESVSVSNIWLRPYAPREQWIDALKQPGDVDEVLLLRMSVDPDSV